MNILKLVSKVLRLPKVKKATTTEEIEAIGRFRYRIYIEEFHRSDNFSAHIDHKKKTFLDESDFQSTTVNLYIGSLNAIQATIRIKAYNTDNVNKALLKKYNLN